MQSAKSDNTSKAPSRCPPPGTPEYDAFVERQAHNAFIDAMNAHPILRVLSTVVILILGGGVLWGAWQNLHQGPLWLSVLLAVFSAGGSIGFFGYLKYSWGRRRRNG